MIIVAAGSSLPFCGIDSQQLVLRSFSALRSLVREVEVSPLYKSPAWPDPSDPAYVNAVARIETLMPADQLLSVLQAIEASFGRRRTTRNAPRTLDLDLIAHGDLVTGDEGDRLILPHPRLADRAFVLRPLADIAPNWCHPINGASVVDLLKNVSLEGLERIEAA